jgi:hypothetical protein
VSVLTSADARVGTCRNAVFFKRNLCDYAISLSSILRGHEFRHWFLLFPWPAFKPLRQDKATRRKIPLSTSACMVLSRRLDDEKIKGEYLFPGRSTDSAIVKMSQLILRRRKRAKIVPFRLYDLRHTSATRAARLALSS